MHTVGLYQYLMYNIYKEKKKQKQKQKNKCDPEKQWGPWIS